MIRRTHLSVAIPIALTSAMSPGMQAALTEAFVTPAPTAPQREHWLSLEARQERTQADAEARLAAAEAKRSRRRQRRLQAVLRGQGGAA